MCFILSSNRSITYGVAPVTTVCGSSTQALLCSIINPLVCPLALNSVVPDCQLDTCLSVLLYRASVVELLARRKSFDQSTTTSPCGPYLQFGSIAHGPTRQSRPGRLAWPMLIVHPTQPTVKHPTILSPWAVLVVYHSYDCSIKNYLSCFGSHKPLNVFGNEMVLASLRPASIGPLSIRRLKVFTSASSSSNLRWTTEYWHPPDMLGDQGSLLHIPLVDFSTRMGPNSFCFTEGRIYYVSSDTIYHGHIPIGALPQMYFLLLVSGFLQSNNFSCRSVIFSAYQTLPILSNTVECHGSLLTLKEDGEFFATIVTPNDHQHPRRNGEFFITYKPLDSYGLRPVNLVSVTTFSFMGRYSVCST
eukprot:Gb_08195 [translate_table: standard]